MINKSIFLRLLLSYMLTIILGLCVVGFLMSYLTKDYYMNAKEQDMLRKAKKVNLAIQNYDTSNDYVVNILSFLDQSFDARIWLFDSQGKIISTSTQDEVSIGKSVDKSIVDKVKNGEDSVLPLKIETKNQPMLSVVVPWGKDDQVYGGIILHSPVTGINEAIGNIRETILWVTLVGILLSLAFASYMSWSISRPLQKIEKFATKIGMGDYSERIHIDSSDEIGELASSINQMVNKLEKADQENKKLEQIRIGFLANASHELRTPLTAMQGFLEALLDGLIDENAAQKYHQIIYQEMLHMNRLIDDIMDLSRLENNEFHLSRNPLEVKQLVQKTKIKFEPQAEEKNIHLEVGVGEPISDVYADPDRLEQILNNMVKNAIKFTDPGGTIRINAVQDADYIHFSVADTGIGIPPEELDQIWNRFYKINRSGARNEKGSGLGLAIVKELVHIHEGKVSVESDIGSGTVFHVWIPGIELIQKQKMIETEIL